MLDRQAEVDGYAVNITTFNHDIDATPLMKGLPATAATARTGAT